MAGVEMDRALSLPLTAGLPEKSLLHLRAFTTQLICALEVHGILPEMTIHKQFRKQAIHKNVWKSEKTSNTFGAC